MFKTELIGLFAAMIVGILVSGTVFAENSDFVSVEAAERIRQELQIEDFSLCPLSLPAVLAEQIELVVEYEGIPQILHLQRHSVRGSNLRVHIQIEGGEFVEYEPGPVRTYRGHIKGKTDSVVAASLEPCGLRATVFPENGPGWSIEPMRSVEPTASRGQHIIYRQSYSESVGLLNDALQAPQEDIDFEDNRQEVSGVAGTTEAGSVEIASYAPYGCDVKQTELGFDVDYAYYTFYANSNEDTVVIWLEWLVNNILNSRLVRDALVEHVIGKVIIRTDSKTDPYLTTNINDQLNTLRNIWNALPSGDNTHDLAQLATGQKTEWGGLAWIRQVCTSYRYSVACRAYGSSFWGNASLHEIGHNWGLNHSHGGCPEGNIGIMCGDNSRLHIYEVYTIINHRDSRTCLLNIGPYASPLSPYAALDQVSVQRSDTTVAIDVLANDHDGNCDTIVIDDFDTISEFGAVITRSVGTGPGGRDELVYHALPDKTIYGMVDKFEYIIGDGTGRQGVGNIHVITPPPDFVVIPEDEFAASAVLGCKILPRSRSYTLTNNSLDGLNWTATKTAGWLDVPSGGTINSEDSVIIDVNLTSQAYDLKVGIYCDDIIFTDTTNNIEYSRHVVLEIRPRSMVAHWKLDETVGTTAVDSSGSGFDGNLVGGFKFDTSSVAGPFGRALDFNSSGDYIETDKTAAELDLSGNTAKCITLWVFTRSFNNGGIYSLGQDPNGQDFSLRTRDSDNQWRVQYRGSDANTGNIDFSYDSKNKWVHFAHVYDRTRTMIYADYQLVVDKASTLNTGNDKTFRMGVWNDYYFDGIIDDVRIYNYAPDIDSVISLLHGGRAENPSPFDTQINAPYPATLSWLPGVAAIEQDVYFGTSREAVANATTASDEYKGRQSETYYVPATRKNTEYFWRIDQVISVMPSSPLMSGNIIEPDNLWQTAGPPPPPSIIPGKVWSFTTGQSLGTITREVWTGLCGDYVSDLTGNLLYPDSPNIREEITRLEGPVNASNNYGTRIHGFLTPSETGLYTFWIASDDNSELWLSSDANEDNQVKIAEVLQRTEPQQWDMFPEQSSSPILLTAGRPYYIKVLHKEGEGGDNIAVAWKLEGSCQGRQVIPGSFLSPYDTDLPTPDPMDWATPPHPTGSKSISMTAIDASDRSGVEYYFACKSGDGHDSEWQESATYEDTGLEPNTVYTYTVTARDANPNHNTTVESPLYWARTSLSGDFEPDGDVDFSDYAEFTSHWPGAAMAQSQSGSEADLDDDGDIDLGDLAILVENWLGTVDQSPPFPGQAADPNPSNGEIGVSQNVDLSWKAGFNATSHDVYFGTSSAPAFRGNQIATTFNPGTMTSHKTYYWRIDEVNPNGRARGVVWNFTTPLQPPPSPP